MTAHPDGNPSGCVALYKVGKCYFSVMETKKMYTI